MKPHRHQMAVIIFVSLGLSVCNFLGCHDRPDFHVPPSIEQTTTPEQKAVTDALNETKNMPGPQSCMTQQERDAFRDLRQAADLCNQGLFDQTSKANRCNADLLRCQNSDSLLQAKYDELLRKHRFDWATDFLTEIGAAWIGRFQGFIAAFVVMAIAAVVATVKKWITFG